MRDEFRGGADLAEEVAVLRRISERLGSTLRIEEVLEGIVEEFSDILHADACALYLRDPETQDLVLHAARGYDRRAVGTTRLALGEGLTGWAAQRRRIVASADAAEDRRYAPRPEMGEERYASLLAMPIVREGETVAVVTLQTKYRREFRPHEIRRAARLAEPIYFALENARRHRDLENRLEEVTRLYETVRSIGTSLNLPEVLDEILRAAARILWGRGGTLRILGDDGVLRLRASFNLPEGYDPDALDLHIGEGVSGGVARTLRPARIRREEGEKTPRRHFPFESLVVAPLLHGEKILGTIGVFDRKGPGGRPVQFSEADERILVILAQHAAAAIVHADLYGRVEGLLATSRRRVRELEILHEISKALQSSQTREEALFVILTGVTSGKGLGYNRALALLLDEKGEALVGAMGIGPTMEEVGRVWQEVPRKLETLEDYFDSIDLETIVSSAFHTMVKEIRIPLDRPAETASLPGRALLERRSFLCARRGEYEVDRALAESLRMESFAVVPIWAMDLVIGVLVVDNRFNNRPILAEEIPLLETFSHQAGLGLASVRLLEEVTTAMRRLEETTQKLVEAQRLAVIGEVAAGVAHDIRNPLTAIGGFTRRIEKSLPPEHPSHRHIGIVLKEVGRLERLADDVLDLAKEKPAAWGDVDLARILRDWSRLHAERIEAKGVAIAKEGDAWTGRGDWRLLRQAIGNVLQNALDAAPAGTRVVVRARRDGADTSFEVEDEGAGVEESDREKAFEAFYTTKTTGTGLGLALVAKALRAHRGEARISPRPGGGTRVVLRWPASDVEG